PTPAGGGELCGATREFGRERAVRARAGRVHRRAPAEAGAVRAGARGDDLPGRGGRAAARRAGEAAARAPGAGVRPGGRGESGEGGRAGNRGDESAAGAAGGGGAVPGRPVLSAERVSVGAAAAAGAAGGHLAAGGSLRAAVPDAVRQGGA